MKNCSKCKKTKELAAFPKDGTGAHSWCRECRNLDAKERRAANKPMQREKDKIWRLNRGYRYDKDHQLRTKFGITLQQYEIMEQFQGFKCAICKKQETAMRLGEVKMLAVDHCHVTGKVRSLLCADCNLTLGKMKENFDAILNMARYVQQHNNVI